MVPEQVWDWHFCSYQCVFCFLFVSVFPCLVLSVASWGRVNLAVSSSSWEWRFLYSYERYLLNWFFLWISDSANASSPWKCMYACGWRKNPLMFLKVNFWWQTYRTEKWDPDLSHYLKVGFSGIVFHSKMFLVLFELELHPIGAWRISRVYSEVLWILFVRSNS
jgi:hypothetical protein